MKEISEHQSALQFATGEGYGFPRCAFVIEFKKLNEAAVDVSEKVKQEIEITDANDYRENVIYLSEVPLVLDNSDGYFMNTAENGWLNVDSQSLIEVFIYAYLDHPTVEKATEKIKVFGGWLDISTLKENQFNKLQVDITAMNYLGLGDRRSAARICTKYLEPRGLILWNVGVWLVRANIANKILKNGIHKVESRIDANHHQLRLDEGLWVTIVNSQNQTFILKNPDDTERVEIKYFAASEDPFRTDQTTILIVRNEGEQYPFTLYRDASVFKIVKKAFEEIEIDDMDVRRFEIPTYNGRKVFSFHEVPDNVGADSGYYKINAQVSDGDRYIYMAYRNKILKRNMEDDSYVVLCSVPQGVDYWEIARLDIDLELNLLFFWVNDFGEDYKKLYKFDLIEGIQPVLLFNNATSAHKVRGLLYNNFHWSRNIRKFLFVWDGVSGTGISTLDLNGVEVNLTGQIMSNPNAGSFSMVYEKKNPKVLRFYYIVGSVPGATLVQSTYSFSTGIWAHGVTVVDWDDAPPGHTNVLGTMFYTENKIFFRAYFYDEAFFLKLTPPPVFTTVGNAFDICSAFEYGQRLYVVKKNEGALWQRVGYFVNNVLTLESDNFWKYRLPIITLYNDQQRICITKNYKDVEMLNIIAATPNMLIRFGSWFILNIIGDVDFTDKNIREILTELANNFLAFLKVSCDRVGIFLSRGEYESSPTQAVLKKNYTKERLTERTYNDVYDGVIVSNGETSGQWGNKGIEARVLSVDLQLAPTALLKDYAKYFYDYYLKERKLIKIVYPPAMIQFETLDNADLSDFNIQTGSQKLHKKVQKPASAEYEVLVG